MRHFTRRGNSSIVIEAAKVGTDPIENIVNWCGGQIIEERDPGELHGRLSQVFEQQTSGLLHDVPLG